VFARPPPLTKCLHPENRICVLPPGQRSSLPEARSWPSAAKKGPRPRLRDAVPVGDESGPPLTGEPLPPWTPHVSGSGPEQAALRRRFADSVPGGPTHRSRACGLLRRRPSSRPRVKKEPPVGCTNPRNLIGSA